MSPIDAAKIFLGELLYRNATIKERERGLYAPSSTSDEFNKAVKILKECKFPPEDMVEHIPGGYMMCAAIHAARKW